LVYKQEQALVVQKELRSFSYNTSWSHMLEEQSSSACQKALLSEHSKPSYNIRILYLVNYNIVDILNLKTTLV